MAGLSRNTLAVNNLRLTGIDLNAKIIEQAAKHHFQMQLAHSGQNRLPGVFIFPHTESRVFPLQFLKGEHQLVTILNLARLHRQRDHRLRDSEASKQEGLFSTAEGITGQSIFEARDSDDIPGTSNINAFTLMGMHAEKSRRPLLNVLGRVQQGLPRLQFTGIDAQVSQLASFVGEHLKSQRTKWPRNVTRQQKAFVIIRVAD